VRARVFLVNFELGGEWIAFGGYIPSAGTIGLLGGWFVIYHAQST